MLTIAADILPRTDLTYLAFRTSFRETLERIVLAQQITLCGDWEFGYLTEVPFLRQVTPRVQLDLLLATWQRHLSEDERSADLVDQSVIYAVCETAARMVKNDPAAFGRFLANGPQKLEISRPGKKLTRALKGLQASGGGDGNYLLISQFLDLPPRESKTLKVEFGLRPDDCEPLFEALARWHVSADFEQNAEGLLTDRETAEASAILGIRKPR